MVSSSIISAAADIPTPGHINSINCNSISLNSLFDDLKDTLLSCSVNKIIGVFFLWGLGLLPFLVLFYPPLPLKIASNNDNFLQTKNPICLGSQ